ncbi:MAG: hypothetical protein J0M04_20225 [Verrucomicrobia bacterium]|nr:hypothetical protein [Verrucomicrobiota bacterium]
MSEHSNLPRLPKSHYRGKAWVHWCMSTRARDTGWLDDTMHNSVRELLLHVLGRYRLHCPAYCLMPDHAHFLWMGTGGNTCQLDAAKLFRKWWNVRLAERGTGLQKQAYDHVLAEDERHRDAFENAEIYILRNPQRAGLVEEWHSWPYLGAMVPGYPEIAVHPISAYWPKFWIIHNRTTTVENGNIGMD